MFPHRMTSDGCIDVLFFWLLLKIFGGLDKPPLTLAYIWFNGTKSSVLLSRLKTRQPASVTNLVAREPAWQAATLPSLANLENANVWREVYEQGKDPGTGSGRGGCVGGEGNRRGGSRNKTLFMDLSGADSKQQPPESWTPRRTASTNRGRQRQHNANMSHAK